MRWAQVFAMLTMLTMLTTTCVSARPARRRRRSPTDRTRQLGNADEPQWDCCETANQTLADWARISSNVTSQDMPGSTSNFSSKDTSKLRWQDGSNVTLNTSKLVSEDVTYSVRLSYQRCGVSTCAITELASKLQVGDEKAGGSTTDPHGFGKK